MHDRLDACGAGMGEPGWVSASGTFEPVEAPPEPRSERASGRSALALALLGVVCFGFVLGPIALAMARRAEMASLDDGAPVDGHARAATSIGKVGFAIHLCVALAALPWLLFMLPMLAP